jgi:hypothetical protein
MPPRLRPKTLLNDLPFGALRLRVAAHRGANDHVLPVIGLIELDQRFL